MFRCLFYQIRKEKNMFSLPAPWLHVNRELIAQTSVTCAPWRKGPSPMCWGYKNTTRVFSQADSVFYILPTAGAVWVTVYGAQTAVPGTYLLPCSWDVGCGVEIALLLKRKGSWSLLAQLLNICFILTFPPCRKPPVVTPVTYLVSAENSRSHEFKFWRC